MLDMPHEEEELDVNEFKGSNHITMETRVLPSNDQDITTNVGNVSHTDTTMCGSLNF
jgi:hypothetical protein